MSLPWSDSSVFQSCFIFIGSVIWKTKIVLFRNLFILELSNTRILNMRPTTNYECIYTNGWCTLVNLIIIVIVTWFSHYHSLRCNNKKCAWWWRWQYLNEAKDYRLLIYFTCKMCILTSPWVLLAIHEYLIMIIPHTLGRKRRINF